jgi:CHAT domain/Caspase domain
MAENRRTPCPFSALLVACEGGSDSSACVRDVRQWERFFVDRLGVPRDRVTVSIAPDNADAIMSAFLELVASSPDGAEVFCHFSGYGVEIAGRETPERALTLGDAARHLRASDLARTVAEALARRPDLKITISLDCGLAGLGARIGEDAASRFVEFPASAADDEEGAVGWSTVADAGATVMAACREGEPAFEFACDGREKSGVFSFWLLESLRQAPPGSTYREVFQRTFTKVRSQFVGQTSMWLGDEDRVVLGGLTAAPVSVPVVWVDYYRLIVRLGGVDLAPGSRLVIDPCRGSGCDEDATEIEVIDDGDTDRAGVAARVLRLGRTPPRPGDRAVLREPATVLVRRRVRLDEQALAITGLSRTLDEHGEGFVERVRPGEAADLRVTIDETGCFLVADPSGHPLPNLLPKLRVDEAGSAEALVRRLVHVSRYLATMQLDNAEPTSDSLARVELEALSGREEGRMAVRIRNRGSLAVEVGLLDLRSDWRIKAAGAPFRLEPGEERVFRVEPGCGIVKVFASTGLSGLRWLELPALNSSNPPTTTLSGADSLERSLASFAQAANPKRFLGEWNAVPRCWAVTQLAVDVAPNAVTSPEVEVPKPLVATFVNANFVHRYQYDNLDIRLIRTDRSQLIVEAVGPGVEGFQRISLPAELFAEEPDSGGSPRDVKPRRPWPDEGVTDVDRLRALIGATLVPMETVRGCYDVCRDRAMRDKRGLRLRLFLYDSVVAAIPWESATIDDASIGRRARFPVVRYVLGKGDPKFVEGVRPLRWLGVICHDEGRDDIHHAEERALIAEALRPLEDEGLLTCEWMPINPRARDLRNRLRRGDVQLLHFIGHGTYDDEAQEGTLIFREGGRTSPVAVADFVAILQDTGVQFAFLNACGSGHEAGGLAEELVRRVLPAALGMRRSVRDDVAVALAGHFYRNLSEGVPIDAALSEARCALSLDPDLKHQWPLPILYMRAPDGRLF